MLADAPLSDARPSPLDLVDTSNARRWSWGALYFLLYTVYIVIGSVARVNGWWNGDALWFVWASNHVLDGSWDLYGLRLAPEVAPPDGITYSYSPLLAIITSPIVWLAYALGWGDDGAYRMMGLPLLPLDVLAMHQLRRLVRDLRPSVDERILFPGIALLLFVSSFLHSTAYKGHVEGLLLLFLILTIRTLPRSVLLSGMWAGLALATKHTTTLLALVPVGLIVIANQGASRGHVSGTYKKGSWLRGLTDTASWAGIAVLVFSLFMLPPLVRHPEAVYYSFITLPQHLVTFGPGLPHWVNLALSSALDSSQYEAVLPFILNYSNLFTLFMCVTVPMVVILWAWRRGRPITLMDHRMWGLIALTLTVSILCSKWVSNHYYQLPLAFIFIWDVLRTSSTGQSRGGQSRGGQSQDGKYAFPWLGIGAILGYRSLEQIDIGDSPSFTHVTLPYLTDGLIFGLFAVITVLIVLGIREDTLERTPESETPPLPTMSQNPAW